MPFCDCSASGPERTDGKTIVDPARENGVTECVNGKPVMTCRFYSDDNIIGSGFKLFKYCKDLFTALLVVGKRNAVSQSLAVSVNDDSFVLVFDDVSIPQ